METGTSGDAARVGSAVVQPPKIERLALKIVLGVLFTGLFVAAFFLAAGRADWYQAYAYIVLFTAGQSATALYLRRASPELLVRRGQRGAGTQGWDNICLALFGLGYLAILVVAALDAGRFGWSTMSWWLWPVGALLYLGATVLGAWAMASNPHFESTVRIQSDLGHRVVDSGPYRLVRHPGYLSAFVALPGMPLLLGSAWAALPAALALLLVWLRTALEDRTLRRELAGYTDYAARVRYRICPGVW